MDGLVHRRAEVRRRRIAGVARRLRLREAKGNAGHSAMLGRPARPVFDGGQIDRFPSPARSEGIYRASSFTMSAAFSAIIRVGELVLPEEVVGINEASAMRRPERPWTRRRAYPPDHPRAGKR